MRRMWKDPMLWLPWFAWYPVRLTEWDRQRDQFVRLTRKMAWLRWVERSRYATPVSLRRTFIYREMVLPGAC